MRVSLRVRVLSRTKMAFNSETFREKLGTYLRSFKLSDGAIKNTDGEELHISNLKVEELLRVLNRIKRAIHAASPAANLPGSPLNAEGRSSPNDDGIVADSNTVSSDLNIDTLSEAELYGIAHGSITFQNFARLTNYIDNVLIRLNMNLIEAELKRSFCSTVAICLGIPIPLQEQWDV